MAGGTPAANLPDSKSKRKRDPAKKKTKLCEDCATKNATYGLLSDGVMRWCHACAKVDGKHPGACNLRTKRCEDCSGVGAVYGDALASEAGHSCVTVPLSWSAAEKRKRWCKPCAAAHEGAILLVPMKKCADCGLKKATWGLSSERKRRWCLKCAKSSHVGSIELNNANKKMCEDCQQKSCNYGIASERVRRWCKSCSSQHPDSIDLANRKMCEECAVKQATWGIAAEGLKRWCATCAKVLPIAILLARLRAR